MDRLKTVSPLILAGPLALGTILAGAPQASAAISGVVPSSPRVLDNGKTLNVTFSSDITDAASDNAIARDVAGALGGNGLGDLVKYALSKAPTRTSNCRATVTATDSDGATGTASAAVPVGATNVAVNLPDQTPGTKWGVGDRDRLNVTLICTDSRSGAQLSEVTIDRDETAV